MNHARGTILAVLQSLTRYPLFVWLEWHRTVEHRDKSSRLCDKEATGGQDVYLVRRGQHAYGEVTLSLARLRPIRSCSFLGTSSFFTSLHQFCVILKLHNPFTFFQPLFSRYLVMSR